MVDAMAYSVRRTPSSRARPVGWNNSFRCSLGLRYDPTRQWSLRLGTAYPPPPWLHLPGSRGATRSPSAWRVTASLTPHTLSACLARRANRFDDAFSPVPEGRIRAATGDDLFLAPATVVDDLRARLHST